MIKSEIQVPIYIHKINAHNEIKPEILEIINKSHCSNYINSDQRLSKTNWNDGRDIGYWEVVSPYIYHHFNNFRQVLGPGYDVLEVKTHWFQQYNKKDFHDYHFHDNAIFSGIYYVELPNPKFSTSFVFCGYEFKFDVTEGDIIFFPSLLLHRAPEIEDDTRKTAISFNIGDPR